MKPIIPIIWIVIAMLWASANALAYDFKVDGINYTITSETDRTVEVARKNGGYSGAVEIPKKLFHDGYTYTVTSIGDYAFYKCSSLTSVTIPNSVSSIGDYAFWECHALTSVTIPNSVSSIGDGAFSDCHALTSVTIPSSVSSIGDSAFSDCRALTSVTIPNSVSSIGDYAFSFCFALTSVTIPGSVTSMGYNPFTDCSQLETIDVEPDNARFCSQDGILYNKIMTQLLSCPGKKTSVTIPNSVTSIEHSAFAYGVALTSVTIPNSVTSIGLGAFYGCSSLTSVTIPNSVTSIGNQAFAGCIALTSLTIPNSVTSIGGLAFKECSQIETIYSHIVEPFTCDPRFSDDNYRFTTLYIPKGSLATYEKVDPWCNFWNIEEKDYAGVDGVPSGAEAKTEVGRYNLQGIKVGNDYKGILIIRYSDGSCCKQYSK